ncbi:hypothetical protein FOA52_002643 [Chlamydomonas sp. UWO 241]|nr:hypothetical protein FOA52_002643 [Chlamydomonas sp. UWO 241]
MSVACEVKQLVDRLVQLTDAGLVDGDSEDPVRNAVRALQVKVGALVQRVDALKPQQLEQEQRMAEQLEGMQVALEQQKQQHTECMHVAFTKVQQQQAQQQQHTKRMAAAQSSMAAAELKLHRLYWAVKQKRARQGWFDCYDGGDPRSSENFEETVLRNSLHGQCRFIPSNHHCSWDKDWTEAQYECGRKEFRDALTKQLHALTGVKPSLVQKWSKGQLLWAVRPLLRTAPYFVRLMNSEP